MKFLLVAVAITSLALPLPAMSQDGTQVDDGVWVYPMPGKPPPPPTCHQITKSAVVCSGEVTIQQPPQKWCWSPKKGVYACS